MDLLDELNEYRCHLLQRFAQVVGDLIEAWKQLSGDELEQVDSAGESPRSRIEAFCLAEQKIFLPMIGAILAESHAGSRSSAAADPLDSGDLLAKLERIQIQHQEFASQMHSLPVCAWNMSIRYPLQGMRTLQWWVEQSLAYSCRQLQGIRR